MATVVWVCLISAALIIATSVLHFEVFATVAGLHRQYRLSKRVEIVALLLLTFLSHVVSIGGYAIVFARLHHHPEFGQLAGQLSESPIDFFYFSLACYTTLGFGDVYATGDLRIIAGLEGLNGLVLIAWSASLTFLAVRPNWDDNEP
ncbi:potassium channel family protein [Aminobacter carboxidus]|uniref:Two pore domain potassium channel family protein n=1 Tax=Aminobacter carboxidus TaxID=376165 RepID=A0ABR9GR49_9HYPH|nr:potassium channel family protein [Aminobacter carboxidus]MBE1206159.1 two pore domain potassium channel family protein [Aminobacter carboxidus]